MRTDRLALFLQLGLAASAALTQWRELGRNHPPRAAVRAARHPPGLDSANLDHVDSEWSSTLEPYTIGPRSTVLGGVARLFGRILNRVAYSIGHSLVGGVRWVKALLVQQPALPPHFVLGQGSEYVCGGDDSTDSGSTGSGGCVRIAPVSAAALARAALVASAANLLVALLDGAVGVVVAVAVAARDAASATVSVAVSVAARVAEASRVVRMARILARRADSVPNRARAAVASRAIIRRNRSLDSRCDGRTPSLSPSFARVASKAVRATLAGVGARVASSAMGATVAGARVAKARVVQSRKAWLRAAMWAAAAKAAAAATPCC